MKRRAFLRLSAAAVPMISGCSFLRVDPWHPMVRSDQILSMMDEKRILAPARLTTTEDGKIRVLYVKGSGYDRGYQQGVLLRKEISDNIGWMYKKAVKKFYFEELFAESYERQRPYIPQEYVDEMHGLAHGAKMPLHVIHGIHALPEIGEWGGKKAVKKVIKGMMAGEPEENWGTSCSNFAAFPKATGDGEFYTVRILDWGLHRIAKLHQYPLITVNVPESGVPNCNIGWVGFLGAVSGMNAEGITLGEMGYEDPPGESMRGKPMPFLLREVIQHARNLADVRRILKDSQGTNSFVFLMSDGKAKEAEFYIKDRSRFLVFKPGDEIADRDHRIPPVPGMLYGGHFNELMTEEFKRTTGSITPKIIMDEVIPKIAMKSNFQNVIYDPVNLRFWVNNAKSKDERAAEQPYTHFDLGAFLRGS